MSTKVRLFAGVGTVALCAAIAAPAFAEDLAPTKVGKESEFQDTSKFCGTKKLRVALSDGWGGNTWRKTTRAELEAEAKKCPNITEVAYTDAGGNPDQQIQDIQSLSAQGYDIILVSFDFVQSNLRAMQAARDAGAAVVLYNTGRNPPGELGVNYDAVVTLISSKWESSGANGSSSIPRRSTAGRGIYFPSAAPPALSQS